MEDYERDAMIDSIRCRREEFDQPLAENPPLGPKWMAKQGLNSLNLNGAEYAVMGCLLDRASSHSGLCYPSEEFIAGWTRRPLRTVQRAIRSLWEKRLINITRRSMTSSRYFVQWAPLFSAYRHQKAFEKLNTKRNAQRHAQKVADHVTKSGGSLIQKVATKPSYLEPSNRNLGHEMAHPASPADATVISIENHSSKETQRASESVERPSGFQEKVKPAWWWENRLREAADELMECTNPERRKELGERISACKKRIQETLHEQRSKTDAGRR
jgi:hypothetical protein